MLPLIPLDFCRSCAEEWTHPLSQALNITSHCCPVLSVYLFPLIICVVYLTCYIFLYTESSQVNGASPSTRAQPEDTTTRSKCRAGKKPNKFRESVAHLQGFSALKSKFGLFFHLHVKKKKTHQCRRAVWQCHAIFLGCPRTFLPLSQYTFPPHNPSNLPWKYRKGNNQKCSNILLDWRYLEDSGCKSHLLVIQIQWTAEESSWFQ